MTIHKINTQEVACSSHLLFVVAAIIINSKGELLLSCRPKDKQFGGLWEFAGGKIQSNETKEQALSRELKEELDIFIKPADFTFITEATEENFILYLYSCKIWQGTIKPLEGQIVKWIKPTNLNDFPMPPCDTKLKPLVMDLMVRA